MSEVYPMITRKEALEQNLPYYFQGAVCKHGHVSPRTRVSGNCVGCKPEANKKYLETLKLRGEDFVNDKSKVEKVNPLEFYAEPLKSIGIVDGPLAAAFLQFHFEASQIDKEAGRYLPS